MSTTRDLTHHNRTRLAPGRIGHVAARPAVPLRASSRDFDRPRDADHSERGHSLGALTTSIVQLHVDAFGKGPTFARTDLRGGEYALCLMRDALTRAESSLVASGREDLVHLGREAVYSHFEDDLRGLVEATVEHPVIGFAATVTPELGVVTLMFSLGSQT